MARHSMGPGTHLSDSLRSARSHEPDCRGLGREGFCRKGHGATRGGFRCPYWSTRLPIARGRRFGAPGRESSLRDGPSAKQPLVIARLSFMGKWDYVGKRFEAKGGEQGRVRG